MARFIGAFLFLVATTVLAAAQFNGCPVGFCSSVLGGGGDITPLPTGKILLVDGVSFILKVDAASKICRAGGC